MRVSPKWTFVLPKPPQDTPWVRLCRQRYRGNQTWICVVCKASINLSHSSWHLWASQHMTYIRKHRGLHLRKQWGKNRHIWSQWHLRGFIKIQDHLRLSWASRQVECTICQQRRDLTLTWIFKVAHSLCNVLWVLPTLRRLSQREILSTTSMS